VVEILGIECDRKNSTQSREDHSSEEYIIIMSPQVAKDQEALIEFIVKEITDCSQLVFIDAQHTHALHHVRVLGMNGIDHAERLLLYDERCAKKVRQAREE
jgi:hypothetical protein